MLRTNLRFLSFIEDAYKEHPQSEILLKDYPKGSLLCRQDEQPYKVSVIKEGFVKCCFSEDNGKDFIFEFLGKGEIVGELEAIRGTKCLCSVEAAVDVQAYTFSVSYFRSLLNDSRFSKMLLDELAERIMNTSIKAAYQQLYTVKYGLARLLDLQDKQGIKLSKAEMASYLGVDVRSLNRALKELQH